MKTLLRDPAAGLMHSAVYYGFVVLFLGTVTLEIDHLLPSGLKFLEGRVYQGYSLVLDAFAVIFLGGLGMGRGAPLLAAAVAAPIQDEVGGRLDPGHPGHGWRDGPCRRGGPHIDSGTPQLRGLVVCGLSSELSRSGGEAPPEFIRHSGWAMLAPSWHFSSSCLQRSCATWSPLR